MVNNNDLINYTYSVYGLKIVSEIAISELTPFRKYGCKASSVSISYGIVPKEIEGAVTIGGYIKISKKEFYLYKEGIAHYYVANGNKIIIEPEGMVGMEEIKTFLLGTCFGILLTQRNTIAIHGGSIIINRKGIIITGYTGAGKSTLISALINEGFNFLADDVSTLGVGEEGNLIVYPAYPQQKLCKDAMQRMGYDIKKYSIIDPYREKYSLPSEQCFSKEPVPLAAIYEIVAVENSNVEIIELTGNAKLTTILRNIYRAEVSRLVGYEPNYFKQCLEVAKNIPVYRIVRPKDSISVINQIEVIKKSLNIIDKEGIS